MKKLTLLFISLFAFLTMSAGEVTEAEALQKAQKFMQGKQFKQKNLRRAPAFDKNKSFYVFNAEGQNGFVIVSGDDRTIPILGYADQGSLNLDKLPKNAKVWLEGYAKQIEALGGASITTTPRRVIGTPVKPLLTSHWDQGRPYNNLCPIGWSENCPTGCVATAMAQVMYYHKWPQGEVASPGWDLPATTFKWDLMKDDYDNSDTGESADAVAELMYYCGAAVEMSYGVWESSANVYATDLINHFGYSTAAKTVLRRSYSTEEWEGLIYNELKNARPVLYSGQSGQTDGGYSGGHEFVVDGYDDKGLFHVNWGWSGQSDGYFALSILNPYDKGTGGGTFESGFSILQEAIIGIQPPYEGEVAASPIVYDQGVNCESVSRTSTNEDFELEFWDRIYYWEDEEMEIDFACALYQGGTQVALIGVTDAFVKPWGQITYAHSYATFGASITEGTYEVRPVFRVQGKDEWQRIANFNNNKVILTIKDNELTVSYASSSDNIKNAVQINSCKFENAMKESRSNTAIINWTNNGYMDETTFYLCDEAVSSYVAPGQTGNVMISFVPWGSGDVTIEIAAGDKNNVVWSQAVTIEETLPQELSAIIDFDEQEGETSTRNTINATVTFTNEGENDYNDEVKFVLYPMAKIEVEEEDSYYLSPDGEAITITQQLVLPTGEEKALHVNFSNLTEDKYYGLYVYYYTWDIDPVFVAYRTYFLNKPIPTVTANDASREYGEANPEFTYTIDPAGSLTGVPALSTTATATSNVGTYAITVAKGTIESEFEAVDGKLTVTQAPLKIIAKDYTIKQGDALPTFEVTYEGFKNSETAAVLTAKPTCTTTATSASEPGVYEITVSGATATNYNIDFVKGKLTIQEADPVTITAKSYTIKYGDDLPAFEFTSEGATLNGTPSITCEATKTSPVGTYPIVISKGTVKNYNDTYVNGTLTIEKAPLTITAKDYTIKQGEALPTFEATYDGFKNDETEAVLTKQPMFTTTATSASEPGEYDIIVSGAEAQNYEITYVNGHLTITEADGILGISVEHPADVYDLQGNKVRSKITTLKELPRGVYIINGKKVLIK